MPTPFFRFSQASLCVLLALGLLGCSKTDPDAPLSPAKVEERTTTSGGKQLTAAGISLTFPKDWQTINLTAGQVEEALAPLAKQPRGEEMLQAVRAAAGTGMVKFVVFDPSGSKPGFMNNANLVVTPGAGSATLDQALDASKQQLATMGAQASTSKVNFPAGEFGRLESHLKGPNGLPYVAIGSVQVKSGNVEVVTFSCPNDQAKEFDAKAQEIMKTFKRP